MDEIDPRDLGCNTVSALDKMCCALTMALKEDLFPQLLCSLVA